LLEEDVYPRLTLPRGIPYALSSLLHYVLITLGFFVALATMGLELTRVSVVAGALGVGIGFGLQNIVNNFVSGLILLFERPVQVGDTVQIGEVLGEVRRIGIRASTVRTFEGAEVILPNSELISQAVTNWTLSDRLRRIDVNVGVAYGTDPEVVLKLLADVALGREKILETPTPAALFVGFGESSLDFQLRAWTDRFDEWLRIRSDLAVAVHQALHEAGIALPFPQRDVHLSPLVPVEVRLLPPGARNADRGKP
jgi:small-conductance mechanosensitive channel